MREIFFRGQRFDGVWVEGYFLAKPILEKYFIIIGEDQYMVKHETVGQYTGLTDKNGVKIFEGDIVKITDKDGKSVVYVVELYMGAFALRRMDVEYRLQFIDFPLRCYDFEIIGNIHDNKELLEEGGSE